MNSLKTDTKKRKKNQIHCQRVPQFRCPEIVAIFRSEEGDGADLRAFLSETGDYRMLVLLDGETALSAEDGECLALEADMGVLFPPGICGAVRFASPPTRTILLSFAAASLPCTALQPFRLSSEARNSLLDLQKQLTDAISSGGFVRLQEARLLLELWLLRAFGDGIASPMHDSVTAIRFAEAVNVMQMHLRENLSNEQIAALCHTGLSNLKKIFRQHTGKGISRYFTEMKMQRAMQLLRSGKRVGEAAREVGYVDQNYFCTVFRRIVGVPPGFFRETNTD